MISFPIRCRSAGQSFFIEVTALAAAVVADPGYVVGQRIEPDINHVSLIEINGDAPFEGRTGNTEILQTGQQEVVHHFVLAGNRLDKFRMCIDMFDQPVGIFAHFKEIRFFGCLHDRTSAFGTPPVHQLGFRPEGLIRRAVPAFIGTLVDVALLEHFPEHFLNLQLMIGVGRPDKLVIGGIHQIPDPADLTGHLIHIFLRCNAGILCLLFDLLTVLIGTCLEENIIALHPAEAGDAVSLNDLVGISDMRFSGCVSDSRRKIVGSVSYLHVYSSFTSCFQYAISIIVSDDRQTPNFSACLPIHNHDRIICRSGYNPSHRKFPEAFHGRLLLS